MAAGKQRFPRWWQALIIIAGGIVLGLSSCIGFLSGLNFNGSGGGQALSGLFAIGFFGGIASVLVGFVLLLIAVARAIVGAAREPASGPSLGTTFAAVPAGASIPTTAVLGITAPRDQPALRELQIALVVLMLLPLGSVATTFLIFLNRPRAWGSILLVLSEYVLSQVPYAFALAYTRRGLDRLGIAIAFAASCCFFVEGLLPLFRPHGMFYLERGALLFFWPALFLIGHIVVAVFAFRAGRLAPAEGDDLALIGATFVGVIVYLVVVRFLEIHFLPFLLR